MMRKLPANGKGHKIKMLFARNARAELQQSKWVGRLAIGFILAMYTVFTTVFVLSRAEMPDPLSTEALVSIVLAMAAFGLIIGVTFVWSQVAHERMVKRYALNPCCPDCGRDMVDCLSERRFQWSKCKAMQEG